MSEKCILCAFICFVREIKCASKSTSICVYTALYGNERKLLKSVPYCIAHTMRCTLGSIQHGGWVTRKNINNF